MHQHLQKVAAAKSPGSDHDPLGKSLVRSKVADQRQRNPQRCSHSGSKDSGPEFNCKVHESFELNKPEHV